MAPSTVDGDPTKLTALATLSLKLSMAVPPLVATLAKIALPTID